jgi:hypothetical protein
LEDGGVAVCFIDFMDNLFIEFGDGSSLVRVSAVCVEFGDWVCISACLDLGGLFFLQSLCGGALPGAFWLDSIGVFGFGD